MRRLKQEIQFKQRALLRERVQLTVSAQALKQRTRQRLATPKALAASFGIGFAAALLRQRRPQAHTQGKPTAPSGHWLHLLLRDVAMPIVLGALQTRIAAGKHGYPQDGAA